MSRDEFRSTVPVYKTRSLGGGKLGVECQRSGCGGKFVVNSRRWRESREGGTRPCPYCFAVSWISDRRKDAYESKVGA